MQNRRHVSTQVTWLQIGITVDRRNLAGRQSAIRRPDCFLPGPGFESARGSGARDAADGGYIFCFLNRSMPHMKRVDPSTPILKKHTSPSISPVLALGGCISLIQNIIRAHGPYQGVSASCRPYQGYFDTHLIHEPDTPPVCACVCLRLSSSYAGGRSRDACEPRERKASL